MKSRRLIRLCAGAWTIAVLGILSIPGSELPELPAFGLDKLAHFVIFAILGVIWFLSFEDRFKRPGVAVLIAGILFAGFGEVYQGLLPINRTPDIFDVLANCVGVLIAVVLVQTLRSRREASKSVSQ